MARQGAPPYVTKDNRYSNLTRAVSAVGMTSDNLRDNLTLFRNPWIDPEMSVHAVFASEAKAGDHLDFYAEMGVLIGGPVYPRHLAPAARSRLSLAPPPYGKSWGAGPDRGKRVWSSSARWEGASNSSKSGT